MQETNGSYLRRRYRWALASLVGGALAALLAGAVLGTGPAGLAFQAACAVIWGGALVVAALTRCPVCRARLAAQATQVLPVWCSTRWARRRAAVRAAARPSTSRAAEELTLWGLGGGLSARHAVEHG